MSENKDNPTKTLFECLNKLYKQGQLLLMDADRLMGERGWTPMHNMAPASLSYTLNLPERWYARWIQRFYMPATSEKEEPFIDKILFISIHFTSDGGTNVDEPVIAAGRIFYEQKMNEKTAQKNYDYYMCKYWHMGESHDHLEGWRKTTGSKYSKNLKGSETFAIPLYEIKSGNDLEKFVIEPLIPLIPNSSNL